MSTSGKHPELEAMETVHKALEPLDPEARRRVLDWITSILDITKSPEQEVNRHQGFSKPNGTTKEELPKGTSIEDFVTSKQPKDTYQRLACLAYYLEHYENKLDISSKDLTQANSDARQVEISNIGTFLNLATQRHGLFTATGRSKRRISARCKAVVEALPDQEAVKVALAQNPMPKRTGRKPKSRKSK